MRVNIDEIKEEGLERGWDIAREQVDEMVSGDNAGYRASGPAHVDARLEKIERRVFVHARTRAALTAACGRCLVPVKVDVPVDFKLTLVPDDEYAESEPEDERESARTSASFDPKAVDEDTFHGKVVDLDPIFREQLLLALPQYPVCQESCKGLCSVCGANLNDRDCGCDRHVPDPRWAALKDVKL